MHAGTPVTNNKNLYLIFFHFQVDASENYWRDLSFFFIIKAMSKTLVHDYQPTSQNEYTRIPM